MKTKSLSCVLVLGLVGATSASAGFCKDSARGGNDEQIQKCFESKELGKRFRRVDTSIGYSIYYHDTKRLEFGGELYEFSRDTYGVKTFDLGHSYAMEKLRRGECNGWDDTMMMPSPVSSRPAIADLELADETARMNAICDSFTSAYRRTGVNEVRCTGAKWSIYIPRCTL